MNSNHYIPVAFEADVPPDGQVFVEAMVNIYRARIYRVWAVQRGRRWLVTDKISDEVRLEMEAVAHHCYLEEVEKAWIWARGCWGNICEN